MPKKTSKATFNTFILGELTRIWKKQQHLVANLSVLKDLGGERLLLLYCAWEFIGLPFNAFALFMLPRMEGKNLAGLLATARLVKIPLNSIGFGGNILHCGNGYVA